MPRDNLRAKGGAELAAAPLTAGERRRAPPGNPRDRAMLQVLEAVTSLVAEGGVFMVDTAQLLRAAGAKPHFFLSGAPSFTETQYAIEEAFTRYLQESPYLTADADNARLYFVPQYTQHEVVHCSYVLGRNWHECCAEVRDSYTLPLARAVRALPAWRRSGGRNFVWLFPNDWADEIYTGLPQLLSPSLLLAHVTTWSGWDSHDPAHTHPAGAPRNNTIAIPAFAGAVAWGEAETRRAVLNGGAAARGDAQMLALLQEQPGPACAARGGNATPNLAFFAGAYQGDTLYSMGIRQQLFSDFGVAGTSLDPRVRIFERLDNADYREALATSAFCLCPPGWAPWSPRLYHALSAGCIPVLFDGPASLSMSLPFSHLVPWDTFVVSVPPGTKGAALVAQLDAISEAARCKMRRSISIWKDFLLWATAPDTALCVVLSQAYNRSAQIGAGQLEGGS
jgi:hypothetical protein